jgi:hypothetical protein
VVGEPRAQTVEGRLILHLLAIVVPGLIALALAAAVVLRMGDRRQKTAMIAVAICWIAATLGQVVTGHMTAPLVVGDVVFSLWMLWFAWRGASWWIWVLLAVQASRLVLHSVVYGFSAGIPYATIYDSLSLIGLVVLALAAVLHARRPAGEKQD